MAEINKRLSKLQSTLLTSGLQKENQPLFQVINQLIKVMMDIEASSSSGSGTGSGSGTSGSGSEWSVLTNGDPVNPELIFAGGDVIMVHTP